MGRDLSYCFTNDKTIGDRTFDSTLEMEELNQFRNYCCWMEQVFTYNELSEYIKSAVAEEEWKTVEALSHIMNLWSDDYVFINSG
jgi:hypothetical protein